MIKAQPYRDQLQALFGDSAFGEPVLWFSSVLLGMLFCKIVYETMNAMSTVYSKAYRQLSKMEKIEWDNRGFSTAHALLVSGIAAHLLIFSDFFDDTAAYGPVLFRSTIFSQIIIGVSIGYFISDLSMILWFYPALGGAEYVLHHLIPASSMVLSLYSGHAHIYIFMAAFTEITTPFVNLRWYLHAAGLKNSKAYFFNGVLLLFVWLIVRILLFMHAFLHIYLHYDQVREIIAPGFYFVILAPPSLGIFNIIWFYKIVRGLLRTLSKRA